MNRRQRRAQGQSQNQLDSAEKIPLAHPDRSHAATKTKTLYELAAEKQAALMPHTTASADALSSENIVNVRIGLNGEIIKEEDGQQLDVRNDLLGKEAVPPFLDTLFLATSLSALHFTLDVLTVHQYAQELLFKPIIQRTITIAFPTLFLLVHLFRGHLFPQSLSNVSSRTRQGFRLCQQACFVLIANFAGCYLIQLTNDKGYYAVMKDAPSVGTVWVWAVLELGLVGALAGVVGPGAYAWYWGYGII